MERLTSRQNEWVRRLRRLGADRGFRREQGEFLCDGAKLLREALAHGAEVTAVLWAGEPFLSPPGAAQFSVPRELLDYVSPLKHGAELLFSARIRPWEPVSPGRTLLLETIQDPGNLGTILRTANALGMDTVLLTGNCADPYGPKAVRAGMGAVFRQRFLELTWEEACAYLRAHGQKLWGASLSPRAGALRGALPPDTAIAVGSEGQGLSPALLKACDGEIVIPMNPDCESLNAAVAAAILMWELTRRERERGTEA